MKDFHQVDPGKMHYSELARGVSHLKGTGGQENMCEAVQRYAEEYAKEYSAERTMVIVENFMKNMNFTLEQSLDAAGIQGEKKEQVTQENTALTMKSGALKVYATPAMIALMEQAAYTSVAGELEEGQGTVGTLMNVSHISATPVGMEVTAKSELVKVDGRKLVFHVEAYDERGKIGEGEHERFIIDNEKFQNKADNK